MSKKEEVSDGDVSQVSAEILAQTKNVEAWRQQRREAYRNRIIQQQQQQQNHPDQPSSSVQFQQPQQQQQRQSTGAENQSKILSILHKRSRAREGGESNKNEEQQAQQVQQAPQRENMEDAPAPVVPTLKKDAAIANIMDKLRQSKPPQAASSSSTDMESSAKAHRGDESAHTVQASLPLPQREELLPPTTTSSAAANPVASSSSSSSLKDQLLQAYLKKK